MDDNDQLYVPIFDDDEDDEGTPEGDERQNSSFLIGAIVLAAVFVLGICAIVIYLAVIRPRQTGVADDDNIALTNQVNIQTATAFVEQQILTETAPTPGGEQTTEPGGATGGAEDASPTPTTGIDVTVIGTEETEEPDTPEPGGEGTEVAEVTPGTPGAGGTGTPTPLAPAGTGTPATQTPTLTPTRGTSGIIEVTPLGGPTPTRIGGSPAPTAVGGTPGPGATATGVGGPVQPTATALPDTGFEGGTGLAGAGVLAVLLVAVVVIVRRMRLK